MVDKTFAEYNELVSGCRR